VGVRVYEPGQQRRASSIDDWQMTPLRQVTPDGANRAARDGDLRAWQDADPVEETDVGNQKISGSRRLCDRWWPREQSTQDQDDCGDSRPQVLHQQFSPFAKNSETG
jgi:hypothetical protein